MVVQDVMRVQNRIKSLYQSRGISVAGKAVYSAKGREPLLPRLPDATRAAGRARRGGSRRHRRESEPEALFHAGHVAHQVPLRPGVILGVESERPCSDFKFAHCDRLAF